MVAYWPEPDINATQIQSLYEAAARQAFPQPFVETGLGGLAPEIRQQIYSNLLATPSPYGGRDLRIEQAQTVGRPPIPLTDFVDLKTSCLTILRVCRQIYLEAFPIFYASKSYYLADSQDLATFSKFGGYWKIGPRIFRFDTITSLCLRNLTSESPAWNPQQINDLMSRGLSFVRGELEMERITDLDSKLIFVDLRKMTRLRKICLCMFVGQEMQYLEFLFKIKGFLRGAIDFVDNFHWTIRSQRLLGEDWNLQYSAFYMSGKNFEQLDYNDSKIQGEVLDIDSRASDLTGGDERWVEVEIGERDYDNDWKPESQRIASITSAQVSEHQQLLVDPSTIDESDYGSEDLQEQIDWEDGASRTGDELDEELDLPQGQSTQTFSEPDEELGSQPGQSDGEGDGAQTSNEQHQESMDLQEQPDVENLRPKRNDTLDQGSVYPQATADVDKHIPQPKSDTGQESEMSWGPPNEDYSGASVEIGLRTRSEDLQSPLDVRESNVSMAIESHHGQEDFVDLVDEEIPYVQAETSPPQILALDPDEGNEDSVEAQPGDKTQATAELSLELQYQNYRDTQTQTEPEDSEHCNAETQTEPRVFPEDIQTDFQNTTAATQSCLPLDQFPLYQPKVNDEQQVAALSKPKPSKELDDSTKSQSGTKITATSLEIPKDSSISQNSLRVPSSPHVRQSSEMPPPTTDENTNPEGKHQSLLTTGTKPYLHESVRAAALMVALSLLYVILYAKLENMVVQMLALFLFVLLFFVALWSKSD